MTTSQLFKIEKAKDWIYSVLAQQSIQIKAPIEQIHAQRWSTVLRVPTDAGNVYFKSATGVFAFEPATTQSLYRLQPDCIPKVLGIDADRGWMLMVDGGTTVRVAFNEGLEMVAWKDILADYARLQIDITEHVDELLTVGVQDQRLTILHQLYAEILADTSWLLIDEPEGITIAEYERLMAFAPDVTAMCNKLAGYAILASIHHNDLHDGNIFHNNGRFLFFDWGDSSIAHPFFSLRTAFVSMEYKFGLAEGDPIFNDYTTAYLEQWQQFESMDNLWAAFKLAERLWTLSTAVKYKTFLSQSTALRTEYASVLPELMQEFLAANGDLDH